MQRSTARGRKHPNQEYIQLDTSNILFICGGAFVDLDQIVEQRTGNRMLGYSAESPKEASELLAEVRPEDLVKYGLIPEFIGRLPVVSLLEELTRTELVRILKDTKNSLLKQYRKLFLMEGADLHFTRSHFGDCRPSPRNENRCPGPAIDYGEHHARGHV